MMTRATIGIWSMVGVSSAVAAGVVGELPIDSAAIDAVGRWPVTIALIGLSGFSVWRAFRCAEKQADALLELTRQLQQRPCVRDPRND